VPHIHKDIDFTVSVYIVFQGAVLLRMHEKYHTWFPPGGHIELTEDPNEAALREVKEETGLDVSLVAPRPSPADFGEGPRKKGLVAPFYFNIHNTEPDHRHADFIFFATAITDEVRPEHEGEQLAWLSREDIEKREDLRPSVRWYALEALKTLCE
jgi:8-oxo-dGTP pyrophosphatase MutT (NUDIX family)